MVLEALGRFPQLWRARDADERVRLSGLELDYIGLCWGGDLIWTDAGWTPRMMRAPRWQRVHAPDKLRFRLNGYRVLLTRGRAGSILYVPRGDAEDPTRPPDEADRVAEVLIAAGCVSL